MIPRVPFDEQLAAANKEFFIMREPTFYTASESCRIDNIWMEQMGTLPHVTSQQALRSHRVLQHTLTNAGVAVKVVSQRSPEAMESVFVSDTFVCVRNELIPEGAVFITPMRWPARRLEASASLADDVLGFVTSLRLLDGEPAYKHVIDMKHFEAQDLALEGRGTIMFDWKGHVIYSVESQRSSQACLDYFTNEISRLTGITFRSCLIAAADPRGKGPMFHLSAFFTIFEKAQLCMVCWECFTDKEQAEDVRKSLVASGLRIIDVNYEEMWDMLTLGVEFRSPTGLGLLMPRELKDRTPQELHEIYTHIVYAEEIDVYQEVGGGALECMTQVVSLH